MRSSEGARLSLIWLELKSRQRRHIWVEFVVGSLVWSEMFFSGYSDSPFPSKTNFSKFQLDHWMFYLKIVIMIIILIIIIIIIIIVISIIISLIIIIIIITIIIIIIVSVITVDSR